MSVRKLLTAGIAGLVLAATAACSSSADADDAAPSSSASGGVATVEAPDTLRIAYQLIPNGDLVVKNQKLLEKAFGDNVQIEWKQFDSGGKVNEAVLSKSVDIGLAGSSPVSRGLSTGVEYQVPWIFDVIGTAEALAAKPGIATVADLKGKTIATPFASTAHYSLLAALEEAGIAQKDVKIIDSEPDAILAAWKAGQIDAAYVWNPVLAELTKDGGTILTDSAKLAATGKTTYDLAVVTTDFATKYPEAVQTWLNAQNEAVGQLKAGDAKAYESIAAELSIPVDEVKKQTAGLQFVDAAEQAGATYLGGGLATNLFAAAEFNKALGEIPSVSSQQAYTDAVLTTFAQNAK